MPVAVSCSHCKSRLKLGEKFVGKTVKCPKCGEAFKVVADDDEAEETGIQAGGRGRRAADDEDERPLSKRRADDDDDEPRARRRGDDEDDDEDEEEERPRRSRRKRQEKSNKGLIIGLCAGGGVLVLLGAVGIGLAVMKGRTPAAPPPAVAAAPVAAAPAAPPPQPAAPAAPANPPPAPAAPANPPPPPPAPLALQPAPAVGAGENPKAPAGWRAYAPKDFAFGVFMPVQGSTREAERSVGVKGLGIVRFRGTRVEPNLGPAYSAGVIILPLKYRTAPADELTKAFRDVFVNDSKGTVTDEKDINHAGIDGKELILQTGQSMMRLRVFVFEGRVYRLEVAGTQAQVEAVDAGLFLGSLRVPPKGTLSVAPPPM